MRMRGSGETETINRDRDHQQEMSDDPLYGITIDTDPEAMRLRAAEVWQKLCDRHRQEDGSVDYAALIQDGHSDVAVLTLNPHIDPKILDEIADAVIRVEDEQGAVGEIGAYISALVNNPNCQPHTASRLLRSGNPICQFWAAGYRRLSEQDRKWLRRDPWLLTRYATSNPTADEEALRLAHRQDIDQLGIILNPACPRELRERVADMALAEIARRARNNLFDEYKTQKGERTSELSNAALASLTYHLSKRADGSPYLKMAHLAWNEPEAADRITAMFRNEQARWTDEQIRLACDLIQEGWKGTLSELAAVVGADLPTAETN